MRRIFGFAGFATLALTVVPASARAQIPAVPTAPAGSSAAASLSQATGFGLSAVHLALQFNPPSWDMLDRILYRDSLRWVANVYIQGSLQDVRLVSGSYASGYWSARGNYSFENRVLRGRYTGWVIFHFQDGRAYCLEYHDAVGECRTPYG